MRIAFTIGEKCVWLHKNAEYRIIRVSKMGGGNVNIIIWQRSEIYQNCNWLRLLVLHLNLAHLKGSANCVHSALDAIPSALLQCVKVIKENLVHFNICKASIVAAWILFRNVCETVCSTFASVIFFAFANCAEHGH